MKKLTFFHTISSVHHTPLTQTPPTIPGYPSVPRPPSPPGPRGSSGRHNSHTQSSSPSASPARYPVSGCLRPSAPRRGSGRPAPASSHPTFTYNTFEMSYFIPSFIEQGSCLSTHFPQFCDVQAITIQPAQEKRTCEK